MTDRFVGPGGNDGNSGLTWALRKLTLNGVEDTPVVAGDDVYVGPGVYRETLTLDVNGAPGNIITYIADVTGEHTDGVGGVVRVTGTDNDQTNVRDYCINTTYKEHRTFRGFRFDCAADVMILILWAYIIFEDCSFMEGRHGIFAAYDANATSCVVRRCLFSGLQGAIYLVGDEVVERSADVTIENCAFVGGQLGVYSTAVDDVFISNCQFHGLGTAIVTSVALAGTISVENNIFGGNDTALFAIAAGDIVEDFNTFYNNGADRVNVNVGADSEAYPPLLASPILHSGASQVSGFKFPWWFGELSEWSQIAARTGADERAVDLHGIARPVTAGKNSWGPLQFADMERETGTKRTGSVSMAIRDAGRHQIWVPVTATSTTISVYVYREANYAGNLPQMIIKQPGQADDVTTDVGAAGGWNLLTTTLVPATLPPYVVVELVSRNTNGAADETFFDDLDVS